MANEEERRWIVEPPGRGEVALYLAFGDGVELTEAQEAAVGELLRTLEERDAEVTGHASAKCPKESSCDVLRCKPVACNLRCGTLRSATAAGGAGWDLMGTFGGVAQ